MMRSVKEMKKVLKISATALVSAVMFSTSGISMAMKSARDPSSDSVCEQQVEDDEKASMVEALTPYIGAEQANALVNNELRFIYLTNKSIGDAGAQALADMLRVNSTIVRLDLSNNNIGDIGKKALADAMESNITVTDLCL